PSTNPLFTNAEQLIPAAKAPAKGPEFDVVLQPFAGRAFVRGIEQSNSGIGPMAIAETPEGDILVSGGPTPGWIDKVGHDGSGVVAVFDPDAHTFTHFSTHINRRVASLGFAPDGTLWASTWPDRHQLVRFNAQHRAETMLQFDADIDSLAFGKPGTDLAGLL